MTDKLKSFRFNKKDPIKVKNVNGKAKWTAINKISKEKIRLLVMDGWNNKQICEFFGMTEKGWINYKRNHPAFFAKFQDWRLEAVKQVEKGLFKRAKGYDYEEEEKEQVPLTRRDGKRKLVTIKIKRSKKRMPGNVDAAKFILTNKLRDQYSNRQDNNNMNMDGQIDDKNFANKFFGLTEEGSDD